MSALKYRGYAYSEFEPGHLTFEVETDDAAGIANAAMALHLDPRLVFITERDAHGVPLKTKSLDQLMEMEMDHG